MRKLSENLFAPAFDRSRTGELRKEDMLIINDFVERHHLKEGSYIFNPDQSVDFNQNIKILEEDLVDKKIPFKIGKVNGNFFVYGIPLISFENCPNEVTGDFVCYWTNISSLVGAPERVGKSFSLVNCTALTSLEGSPKFVGKDYDIRDSIHIDKNTLKYITPEIGGDLILGEHFDSFKDDVKQYSNIKGSIIK